MNVIVQNQYKAVLLSSLQKVFQDTQPQYQPECLIFTALKEELFSFQMAYTSKQEIIEYATVNVISPIEKYIWVREVIEIPSAYPCHSVTDDNYLRTKPGLYPDLLRDLKNNMVQVLPNRWKSLWIDVQTSQDIPAGKHPITIQMFSQEGELMISQHTEITIFDVILPKQQLIHTQWFHGDCLADYYQVPVFSERHWEIMQNFIQTAANHGINMILTPQFTPPLDTAQGGERTTIQLIDVIKEGKQYFFGFDKLQRWIKMCLDVGIEYFEFSHLFTQWGVTSAPKVMATVDGVYQKLFGWDTPAVGGAYTEFLKIYLPQLTQKLKEWGVEKRCWFHISDEPSLQHLENYQAAKASVAEELEGFTLIDALSNYEFYKTGAVQIPVCANNHIEPFLKHHVKRLWSYYCTAQKIDVSNRFFSMPSARNRIYGIQVYKYDIEGILHWGYNFYNSQHSIDTINPYQVSDALNAFPSGDPFIVYPKADGTAEESIRLMVQTHMIADIRAMKLLEQLTSKEFVMSFVEGDLASPITFSSYPKSDFYFVALRNRINREIAKCMNKQLGK